MRIKGKNGCDVWNPRSTAGTTKPEAAQDQLVQKHYEGAATQDDRAVQHSPKPNIYMADPHVSQAFLKDVQQKLVS